MSQLKKRNRKTSGNSTASSGGSGAEGPPPALNTPFKAARAQLIEAFKVTKQPPRPAPPPPPPKPEPEPNPMSDADLFLQEMGGVHRLGAGGGGGGGGGRERAAEVERAVVVRQTDDAEAYAQLSDLVEGTGPFDISDTDEYIEGIAPGLDRRLLIRLRRGDYAVQAHTDLHGLNREEARVRVDQFIQESRLRGRRCVLIVHGRGLNSKDQIPVLKEAVRIWLLRGRLARAVLCFATAQPTDGGAGAVYVLLRR